MTANKNKLNTLIHKNTNPCLYKKIQTYSHTALLPVIDLYWYKRGCTNEIIMTAVEGLMEKLDQIIALLQITSGIVSPEISAYALEQILHIENNYIQAQEKLSQDGYSDTNAFVNIQALEIKKEDKIVTNLNLREFRTKCVDVNSSLRLIILKTLSIHQVRKQMVVNIVKKIYDLNETIVHEKDITEISDIYATNYQLRREKKYTQRQIDYIQTSKYTILQIKEYLTSLKQAFS